MSNNNGRGAKPSPKHPVEKISSKARPILVSPEVSPMGMYDQESLYPHLITEVSGNRVAVPLGEAGVGFDASYEVAPFTYQSIPQPEFELGWWFPVKRVRLLGLDREVGKFGPSPGAIEVRPDASMAMYCMSFRGYTQWVPIPGCRTRKQPGNVYKKWEIIVGGAGQEASRVMVRYDGDLDAFEHWPEDC